jgi:hypothetical protein
MPTSQLPQRLPTEQPLLMLMLLQGLTVTLSSSRMEQQPPHPCRKTEALQQVQMPQLQLMLTAQQPKQQQRLRRQQQQQHTL